MDWQRAVQGTVTGLGYDLVDAQRSAGGMLRVFIDKNLDSSAHAGVGSSSAEAFITVDDCEKVTRQLQYVLEVEGCDYQRLEVSSPGLDRPLKKAADYERFSGETIDLTLKVALKGRKKFRGVLRSADAGWCIVWDDADVQQALEFQLEDVREARLVPVLDFKGRRFAAEPAAGDGRHGDGVQGDRKQ